MPAGTVLGFTNDGAEFDELALARKNDGVTETWDEILAMPEEEALAKVTVFAPLFAAAGTTAEGTIALEQEGDYIALCFIPQGTAGTIELPDPSASPNPSAPPPEGLGSGAPHFLLGMRQAFVVTAAGSSPGPLPVTPPSMAPVPAATASPAAWIGRYLRRLRAEAPTRASAVREARTSAAGRSDARSPSASHRGRCGSRNPDRRRRASEPSTTVRP